MVDNGTKFGALLRGLREAKGLTQEELAERVGVHFTYVSKLETGKHDIPFRSDRRDRILRIDQALGADGALMEAAGFAPTVEPGGLSFRERILVEESLTTQQKQALLVVFDAITGH